MAVTSIKQFEYSSTTQKKFQVVLVVKSTDFHNNEANLDSQNAIHSAPL